MIRRYVTYFREMFPLKTNVSYAVLTYFSLYGLIHVILGLPEVHVHRTTLTGCLTLFGVLLLMRILDEFKDVETDRRLFPNRPLLRGSVKYSDIRNLGIFAFTIISILNAIEGGWILVMYAVMMIFDWLTFKWFYREKIIRENLVLALITHQPLTILVNTYVASTAVKGYALTGHYILVILAVVTFFFPVLSWETSRKIRANGKETDYVTYSKLFGPQKAALFSLCSLLLYFSLTALLAFKLGFNTWFFVVWVGVFLYVLGVFGRFILQPVEKYQVLKQTTEIAVILTLLLITSYLLISKGITWI